VSRKPTPRLANTNGRSSPHSTFTEQSREHIAIAKADNVRVNDEIRADQVRVVEPDGDHAVHPIDDAIDIAFEHELDLVQVAPNADPPVCKVIDYGKYKYKQQKKEKERRKKAQTTQLKELRFRPRTDDHDFQFKTDHARDFLEDGNKVRAYVQFRGRDIVYKDQGMEMLKKFIEELQDIARIDQPPQMEGRRMTTILAPHKT